MHDPAHRSASTAHPHAGEENYAPPCGKLLMSGSSPLTRGKQSGITQILDNTGSIPDHAGKTHPRCNSSNPARAHPRSRGENGLHSIPIVRALGSSPRGRGKLRTSPRVHAGGGLIPVRAGKTGRRLELLQPSRAHPRSRGENVIPIASQIGQAGSSPRGRGKRRTTDASFRRSGLIPARAGKTRASGGQVPPWGAHPRAGGENSKTIKLNIFELGSSPRGRGKLAREALQRVFDGLIPARAGKTFSRRVVLCLTWAHPRAGGENPAPRLTRATSPDSSPRGRGKHVLAGFGCADAGLIPARAGKTCFLRS